MLFDIRGRRKHVVRVVYAILALLMGASLFLVVGPFNIGSLVGNGGTTEAEQGPAANRRNGPNRSCAANPNNEDLLIALTRARFDAANSLTEVNSETGATVFTPEGRQELERGIEAWNSYLKQAKEPKASMALLASRGYFGLAESSVSFEEAVENVVGAAKTQRIAAEAQPTVNSLTTLAIYEYYAGNFAAGDKAVKQSGSQSAEQGRSQGNRQTDGGIPQARQGLRSAEEGSRQRRKEARQRTPGKPPRRPIRRRWHAGRIARGVPPAKPPRSYMQTILPRLGHGWSTFLRQLEQEAACAPMGIDRRAAPDQALEHPGGLAQAVEDHHRPDTWGHFTCLDSSGRWSIAPPFQRLRRIRQLGMVHLVYPGATHTRFSHALGALRVVQDLLDIILEQRNGRDPEHDLFAQWWESDPDRDKKAFKSSVAETIVFARLGTLLHDVCHVAYGHTIEDDLKLLRPSR